MEDKEFKTGLKWWARLTMFFVGSILLLSNWNMSGLLLQYWELSPSHIFVAVILIVSSIAGISLFVIAFSYQMTVGVEGVGFRRLLLKDKYVKYENLSEIAIGGYFLYLGYSRGRLGIDFVNEDWKKAAELIAGYTSEISELKVSGSKKAVKEYFGDRPE